MFHDTALKHEVHATRYVHIHVTIRIVIQIHFRSKWPTTRTRSASSKAYRQKCLFYTKTHHSLKDRDNADSLCQCHVKQCLRLAEAPCFIHMTFPELDLPSSSGDWLALFWRGGDLLSHMRSIWNVIVMVIKYDLNLWQVCVFSASWIKKNVSLFMYIRKDVCLATSCMAGRILSIFGI